MLKLYKNQNIKLMMKNNKKQSNRVTKSFLKKKSKCQNEASQFAYKKNIHNLFAK